MALDLIHVVGGGWGCVLRFWFVLDSGSEIQRFFGFVGIFMTGKVL